MINLASEVPSIAALGKIAASRRDSLDVQPEPYVGRLGANLSRRDFLCGPAFQRQHMTLTVAPPGVGKTSLTIAEAVHMAAGRELFASIAGPTKVWLFNGEESRDELERRISGTIEAHGMDAGLVAENLFFNSGRAQPIMLAETGRDGMRVDEDLADHLVTVIRRNGIKVMIIDPFVSTHGVQENNNAAIDKVGKLWARIAEEGDCAVHLVHHTRKTGRDELTAESVRGASSLVAAARYVRTLTKVGRRSAIELGWSGQGDLVQIDVAKENNSSTTRRDFFTLQSHDLGNGAGDIPSDSIGVVSAFVPTKAPVVATTADLMERIRQTIGDRRDLRQHHAAPDWAGKVLAPILGIDLEHTTKLRLRLAQLVNERILKEDERSSPKGRRLKYLVAGDRLGVAMSVDRALAA